MLQFTSFKSIISKDGISSNVLKSNYIEKIFEEVDIFCEHVFGLKLVQNNINKSNEYEFLIKNGFRRSHNILYNQVCTNCNLCKSIRINAKESQTIRKNYTSNKYIKDKTKG